MTVTTLLIKRFPAFCPISRRSFHGGMAVHLPPSNTWDPTYYWQEGVENIERYRVGGYHPIQLGDQFSHGRYQVIHKLGYGSFSTVWLARDHIDNRYVSLKVVTAAASKLNSEAKIIHRLRQGNADHPGRNFVLSSLDEFSIEGPNGRHQCLVSDVVGSSITEAKEATEHGMLPVKTARGIAAQLALGLAYIHSCDVRHGDLHSKNIAFQLPNLDFWAIEQIHEHFGKPNINMVGRLDDQPLGPEVPPYTVEPAYFWSAEKEGPKQQIKIIDFGEATLSTEERKKLRTPMLLQPPESFFGESVELSADIWAFACTVFDIFGKRSLFEAFMPDKDSVLLEMISTLGMLPDRWWRKWDNRSQYFFTDGTQNTTTMTQTQEPRPLALRIEQMRLGQGGQLGEAPEQLNAEDLAGLQKLLTSMLRYEPVERATTEEVVKSEWLQQLLQESQM